MCGTPDRELESNLSEKALETFELYKELCKGGSITDDEWDNMTFEEIVECFAMDIQNVILAEGKK